MVPVKLLSFFMLLVGMLSCKAQQPSVGDSDHLPQWLTEKISGFKESDNDRARVQAYRYRGDTVYMVEECYGCPDAIAVVYAANGDVLCEFGGIAGSNSCPDFDREARLLRQIWPTQ